MIKIYCDICGELVGTYEHKNACPDDGDILYGHQIHECEHCREAWGKIDVNKVLKRAVLEANAHIPRESE